MSQLSGNLMKYSVLCSIILLLAAVSCGGNAPTAVLPKPPLTAAQICSQRDTVLAQMTGQTIDDYFEVIARLLPGGFGGLTASNMWLKHPDQEDAFRRAASILESCAGGPFPYVANAHYAAVHQGTYDWIELRAWYRVVLNIKPFTAHSSDMDEARNRLSYAFTTEAELVAFRARAIAAGVPAGALYLDVQPLPVALGVTTSP
jgi:hypothetical protein